MRERERHIVGGMIVLMLVAWLGFLVHREPKFAGSFIGTMVGVTAAVFMFVPFVYLIIKRVAPLKAWVTRIVSMRTLLTWHIYAGVLGPILAVIHSAHRFDSTLGSALISLTLVTAVSGFVGRYLLSQISSEIRDKQQLMVGLRTQYETLRANLSEGLQVSLPHFGERMGVLASLSLNAPWQKAKGYTDSHSQLLQLIDAISDVEYAIRMHNTFKAWFTGWLRFHIALSVILLCVLIGHIWAELYLGLRWL
jgi:hypothetical protein